jgi:hypothetical protein
MESTDSVYNVLGLAPYGSHDDFKWLLFNANSAIFQLYQDKNKLIFNDIMMKVRFLLDQHAELDFFNFRSLRKQSNHYVIDVIDLDH